MRVGIAWNERRHPVECRPVAGSTWKFKLLCYMHRTFLLRNLGEKLAQTLNQVSRCSRKGTLKGHFEPAF